MSLRDKQITHHENIACVIVAPRQSSLRRDRQNGQPDCRCFPIQIVALQLIADAGAEMRLLPAYSPDLNPIEMAFSQLKSHLRKAAERTVPALWDRIGQCLDEITPQACANYFAEAGYAPS